MTSVNRRFAAGVALFVILVRAWRSSVSRGVRAVIVLVSTWLPRRVNESMSLRTARTNLVSLSKTPYSRFLSSAARVKLPDVTIATFSSATNTFACRFDSATSFAEGEASARPRKAAKSRADVLTASASMLASVVTSTPGRRSLQNHLASAYLMYGATIRTDLSAVVAKAARSLRQGRLRSWTMP